MGRFRGDVVDDDDDDVLDDDYRDCPLDASDAMRAANSRDAAVRSSRLSLSTIPATMKAAVSILLGRRRDDHEEEEEREGGEAIDGDDIDGDRRGGWEGGSDSLALTKFYGGRRETAAWEDRDDGLDGAAPRDDGDDDGGAVPSSASSVRFFGLRKRRRTEEADDDEYPDDCQSFRSPAFPNEGFYGPRAYGHYPNGFPMFQPPTSWSPPGSRRYDLPHDPHPYFYGRELPFEDHPPKRRLFPIVTVRRILWTCLLALFLWKYGPSDPPPPSDTWMDHFLWTARDICGTVRYVASETAKSALRDLIETTDRVRRGGAVTADAAFKGRREAKTEAEEAGDNEEEVGPCPLIVPAALPSTEGGGGEGRGMDRSATEDYLRRRVVGQDRALRIVADALDAWFGDGNHDDAFDNEVAASHRRQGKGGRGRPPLAILLVGPEGTGKTETARRAGDLLFGHCPDPPTQLSSSLDDGGGVLFLDGADFTVEREGTTTAATAESSLSALAKVLAKRTRSRPGAGLVVIVRRVERMDPEALGALLEAANDPTGAALSYREGAEEEGSVDPRAAQNKNARKSNLDDVAFLLTTDLGVDKLFRLSRKHGGSFGNVPRSDVEAAAEEALRSHLLLASDDDAPEEGGVVGTATRRSDRRLVHAVAPFDPLGRDDLRDVLSQTIDDWSKRGTTNGRWKKLVIAEPIVQSLLDVDRVEYVEWRKRGSEAPFRVFAKRGAHELGDGITGKDGTAAVNVAAKPLPFLKLKLKRCLGLGAGAGGIKRPTSTAVVDRDLTTLEGTVSWCDDDRVNGKNHEEDATSSWSPRERCEEVCRFDMD